MQDPHRENEQSRYKTPFDHEKVFPLLYTTLIVSHVEQRFRSVTPVLQGIYA